MLGKYIAFDYLMDFEKLLKIAFKKELNIFILNLNLMNGWQGLSKVAYLNIVPELTIYSYATDTILYIPYWIRAITTRRYYYILKTILNKTLFVYIATLFRSLSIIIIMCNIPQ